MVHIDPYLNHTAAHLGGKWISPKSRHGRGVRAGAVPRVDHREPLRQEVRRGALHRLRRVEGPTSSARATASPKTPGVAGEGDRRAGARRARARAQVGHEEDLSRRGAGRRPRRRGPQPDGHPVGADDDDPRRDAGLGRPGSNFGNLQFGSPLDFNFYFPGYGEGSFSGEMMASANTANNYQRMPHILTMSSVRQAIPRMVPGGHHAGQGDGLSHRRRVGAGPVLPFGYPSPGHVRVEMLYKYGSSSLGSQVDSNRWIKAYQHESLKFVVNQSSGGRRDAVRGHRSPGLHAVRTLGHRRVVQRRRRVRAPHVLDEQPPRHRDAAQGDRAARRVRRATTTSSP